MQKFTLLICSLCALVVLGIGLSSCKDDDPFVKPNLSVSSESMTVSEAAGTIQVEFVLDAGAPGDITIEYQLGGTAISPADYTVVGDEGEVQIANGATSAVVQIQIVSDAIYEGNETIEISIEDVNSDNVVITGDDETEVTITDDDTQIKASFAVSTLTINEADGIVNVSVALDKPAPTDVVIEYELTGSARDSVTARAADPDLPTDYAIAGTTTPGQLTIKAGQTSGIIKVRPYTDAALEDGDPDTDPFDAETIIITIVDATDGIDFSTNNKIDIALEQQDGLAILLFWPEPDAGQQADMDMFVRYGPNITTWTGLLFGSAAESFDAPEFVFIPKSLSFLAYGMSYVYYEGTLDPLEFEVVFADFVDGAFEAEANVESFTGTYTAANKNEWTDPNTTKVVQTFKKVSGEFAEFSAIDVPASGSRLAPHKISSKLLHKLKATKPSRLD